MSSLVVPSADELQAMSPAARERVLRGLDRERRQVEAAIATVVQRVESFGGHLDDGHRTVRAWGRAACNWSSPEAFGFARTARLFSKLPTAAEAAGRGELGVAQMQALARVVANPRVAGHLAEGEEELVGQAQVLDFDDYERFLRAWTLAADPDGAYVDHDRAHKERRANLSIVGARTFLDAVGGNAAGVQWKEILDAFAHSEFLADWEQGVAEHGDQMSAALMARSEGQRRFDALGAIFLAAASALPEAQRGNGPVVNLVIGYDQFTYELQRSLGGTAAPLDPNDRLHRCHTIDGDAVDPRDVLIAAAMGHVRRVVIDSAGVIVDQGRKQRLFTGALRDAVLLLSAHCVWPGCGCPASKCQADHLLPYSQDGPTAVINSGPGCGGHNRWKNKGYTTCRDPHGHWHTYRPDGTEIGWRADTKRDAPAHTD